MNSKENASSNRTWAREGGETLASFFARALTAIVLGLSVCLFVVLLCTLGAAAITGNESLVVEARNLLLWAGSAVLAALVVTTAF